MLQLTELILAVFAYRYWQTKAIVVLVALFATQAIAAAFAGNVLFDAVGLLTGLAGVVLLGSMTFIRKEAGLPAVVALHKHLASGQMPSLILLKQLWLQAVRPPAAQTPADSPELTGTAQPPTEQDPHGSNVH